MLAFVRHHLGLWMLVLSVALLAFAHALYLAINGWDGAGTPLRSIALGTILLAASGWLLVRQLRRGFEVD